MTRRFLTTSEACELYRWPTRKALHNWMVRLPASVRAALVLKRGRTVLFDAERLERYMRTGQVEADPFKRRTA
jgi:hypothetical protein